MNKTKVVENRNIYHLKSNFANLLLITCIYIYIYIQISVVVFLQIPTETDTRPIIDLIGQPQEQLSPVGSEPLYDRLYSNSCSPAAVSPAVVTSTAMSITAVSSAKMDSNIAGLAAVSSTKMNSNTADLAGVSSTKMDSNTASLTAVSSTVLNLDIADVEAVYPSGVASTASSSEAVDITVGPKNVAVTTQSSREPQRYIFAGSGSPLVSNRFRGSPLVRLDAKIASGVAASGLIPLHQRRAGSRDSLVEAVTGGVNLGANMAARNKALKPAAPNSHYLGRPVSVHGEHHLKQLQELSLQVQSQELLSQERQTSHDRSISQHQELHLKRPDSAEPQSSILQSEVLQTQFPKSQHPHRKSLLQSSNLHTQLNPSQAHLQPQELQKQCLKVQSQPQELLTQSVQLNYPHQDQQVRRSDLNIKLQHEQSQMLERCPATQPQLQECQSQMDRDQRVLQHGELRLKPHVGQEESAAQCKRAGAHQSLDARQQQLQRLSVRAMSPPLSTPGHNPNQMQPTVRPSLHCGAAYASSYVSEVRQPGPYAHENSTLFRPAQPFTRPDTATTPLGPTYNVAAALDPTYNKSNDVGRRRERQASPGAPGGLAIHSAHVYSGVPQGDRRRSMGPDSAKNKDCKVQ